jgi:hypothetical protein
MRITCQQEEEQEDEEDDDMCIIIFLVEKSYEGISKARSPGR